MRISDWSSDVCSSDLNTGFLLPPLQSRETIETSVRNIRQLQAAIGRPLAFEIAANYLKPLPGEMTDGEFIAEIAERADCGILLDMHNLWCNQLNGRQPVDDVLATLDRKSPRLNSSH